MGKIAEWSGNKHAEGMLLNHTNRRLNDFCNAHQAIYIYGAGKIGTGFKNYLEQCDVPFKGFVTSDTLSDFKKIYKQGETGIVMGLNDQNLGEVLPLINPFVSEQDLFVADSEYRERIGRFSVEYIRNHFALGIRLVSHCNLSCKSCLSFSPICRTDYYEHNELTKDLEQVKELGLPVKEFHFTGGEPYLHPDLFEIFKTTRKLFPDAIIKCITNGTLLNQLSEKQLSELVALRVINQITIYPGCSRDVESFCEKADNLGLDCNMITYEEKKWFTSFKLDEKGSAPENDFYNCHVYTVCAHIASLYRGKIYPCGRPVFIPYFNEYFNTDFKVRDGDFIDIHNTTPEEIYQFKLTRAPFCGYCNSANRELVEWGLSEQSIEEWVHFDKGEEVLAYE